VQRSDLGGLSHVPKAFVELGNMRNAVEARRLKRPAQRDRYAIALARAIARAR
jgi:N-acetylmuramoyl-L-alanine amidase